MIDLNNLHLKTYLTDLEALASNVAWLSDCNPHIEQLRNDKEWITNPENAKHPEKKIIDQIERRYKFYRSKTDGNFNINQRQ